MSLEYENLLRLLNSSDKAAVYDELITKEKHVLDTINRVVNHEQRKKMKTKTITDMSLTSIAIAFHKHIVDFLNEIWQVKSLKQLQDCLSKDERKIFVGIFLILVALLYFFAITTS
jgi:uncharacterized BrkB/YihY/UPF0761 family membrane protein